MSAKPRIALFAGNAARAGYLAQAARLAGAEIEGPVENMGAVSLILGEGDMASAQDFIRHAGVPVLWLGDVPPQEGVRVLQTPLRAAALIEAIHRGIGAAGALPARFAVGAYEVDTRENLWLVAGESPVRLTEKEVAILAILKESAPSMVSRQVMLEKVWAYVEGVETHTLETHIYRLRQKIEVDPSSPAILLTAEDGYRLDG